MSFLRKAFSKRTLGHSKDSSLSGPEISDPTPDQFGYFGNAGHTTGSMDIRGALPKPAPPFYSMNGRRSANGSSSSRIGEEASPPEPPTFTRTPQDNRGGTQQNLKTPNLLKTQPDLGNPWATEAEKHAEAQYYASPVQEVPKLVRPKPSKPNFLVNIAGLSVESPISDPSLTHQSPENDVKDDDSYIPQNRRRLPSLATIQDPYLTPVTPSNVSETTSPISPNDDPQRTRRRRRQENTSFLQAIAESHIDPPTRPLTPVSPDPAAPVVTDEDIPLAKRIEEAAKLARLKAAGPNLVVPQVVQSIVPPLTPPPELEPILDLPPTPPEDDIPPPTPSKFEDPLPVTDLQALQSILDRTLRELQQAKEENQRLQLVQAQQEQDRNLIEKLQAELFTSLTTNPRHSHPPPPTRPPPPIPDNDNDDYPFFTPLTSPSEVTSESDAELLKLRQDSTILRKQLSSSKSRIEALVEDKTQLEQKHRQETIDFLHRLKEKQELEDQRVKEFKRLRTERDLADVRVDSISFENKQLADDRDDILQQLKFQVEENQRMEEEIAELKKEVPKFMTYKSQMREKEDVYNKLNEEKAGWQAQMDVMQHKLSEAERRVRCLDNIERQRYESKQEGGYGFGSTVGRSALLHNSPHVKGPSIDVSAAVSAFNQEIQHAAWMLSDVLERPTTDMLHMVAMLSEHQRRKTKMRAKLIWGEKVTVLLENHAKATKRNDLLMLTCMEVFITHWCVQIIEGWYPYLPSFSDILIQLVEQKSASGDSTFQKICGKQAQVIRTGSGDPDYDTWIKEISDDLSPLLRLSGVRIPSSQSDLLSTKLLPILKLAYNLRLALAERDICGGLELAVPLPDTPFHPTFMDSGDAGKKSRKIAKEASSHATDWTVQESIAGTKAIGLKRTLDGKLGQYEMVVLPQVMFVRELESSV